MRYYIADCHFFHAVLNVAMDKRGFDTVEEKIAFVRGMFDVEATIDKQSTKDNQTYFSLLHEVIFS